MRQDFSVQYDVVVIGAGIAGISAALAAARRGHKTCLIEKQTQIGGLATSGMIFIYLPLCDGEKHQVTFGQAEELLLAGRNYGPYDISENWGGTGKQLDNALLSEGMTELGTAAKPRDRYACMFSPAGMILQLDAILAEAGVDLWLDTLLCDVVNSQGRVTAVEVVNLSGHGTVSAGGFVDASGDASLVRRAGGTVFPGKNHNTPWFVEYHPGSSSSYRMGEPVIMQTIGQCAGDGSSMELTGRTVTSFVRDSWRIMRDYYTDLYSEGRSDRHRVYPLTLPSMPQFRTIARIDGLAAIHTGEYNQYVRDSIGMTGDWRCSGRIWETPYGALIPKDLSGVLAAGRCIASEGDSWEAYRVIPAGAMTGEVAGVAASMAMERKIEPAELPVEQLRTELRKNNFRFHLDEIIGGKNK